MLLMTHAQRQSCRSWMYLNQNLATRLIAIIIWKQTMHFAQAARWAKFNWMNAKAIIVDRTIAASRLDLDSYLGCASIQCILKQTTDSRV